jgi:hypothetical protein
MKKIALFSVLFILTACSSIKTSYDYDKEVDFTKFKTFAFSQQTMELQMDQLNKDRIFRAVKSELTAKGFTESANPDVIIDIHVKGQQYQTATATTTGYGGYGGYGGYYGYRGYGYGSGFTTTQVNYDTYTEGTLMIAMIDKNTNKLVWQGTGVKTIDENASAQKREENINYGVNQIMANYPPKAK